MARARTLTEPAPKATPALTRSLRPSRPRPATGQPAPARAPAPESATTDLVLARLTAQVKALLNQWNGGDARTRVALGGALGEVQQRLEHGRWLGWLEETVPFTSRSALNYIELSTWAKARPAVFEQVAPLGASKVYLMSKLPPAQLDQLLAKPDHLVPGTQRRTTLLLMKYGELMKLLLQLSRPASPPTDPMVALLADARSTANRTIKTIKLLIANKQALDQDAVEDLHDDLIVALQKLSTAYKLD